MITKKYYKQLNTKLSYCTNAYLKFHRNRCSQAKLQHLYWISLQGSIKSSQQQFIILLKGNFPKKYQ